MQMPGNKTLDSIGIYILLLAITLILLYSAPFGGIGCFFVIGDSLLQTNTFMNKIASSLHRGYLPVRMLIYSAVRISPVICSPGSYIH